MLAVNLRFVALFRIQQRIPLPVSYQKRALVPGNTILNYLNIQRFTYFYQTKNKLWSWVGNRLFSFEEDAWGIINSHFSYPSSSPCPNSLFFFPSFPNFFLPIFLPLPQLPILPALGEFAARRGEVFARQRGNPRSGSSWRTKAFGIDCRSKTANTCVRSELIKELCVREFHRNFICSLSEI
jgi:hypothetical protein